MTPLPDRFHHWFEYECACARKTLAMLDSVPADRRSSADYQRAMDRMGHIVAARRRWLHRIAGAEDVAQIFPTVTGLNELDAEIAEMERLWKDYLNRLDEAELDRELEWVAGDGSRCRGRVDELLTHVFTHAFYHRGQIAQLVGSLGGKPENTDYVFWLNRKVH